MGITLLVPAICNPLLKKHEPKVPIQDTVYKNYGGTAPVTNVIHSIIGKIILVLKAR